VHRLPEDVGIYCGNALREQAGHAETGKGQSAMCASHLLALAKRHGVSADEQIRQMQNMAKRAAR